MQAICYVWAISVATGIAAKTVAAENSEKKIEFIPYYASILQFSRRLPHLLGLGVLSCYVGTVNLL